MDDVDVSGLFCKYNFSFFLCYLECLCYSSCSFDLNVFLHGSHFQMLSVIYDWFYPPAD